MPVASRKAARRKLRTRWLLQHARSSLAAIQPRWLSALAIGTPKARTYIPPPNRAPPARRKRRRGQQKPHDAWPLKLRAPAGSTAGGAIGFRRVAQVARKTNSHTTYYVSEGRATKRLPELAQAVCT